MKISIDPNKSVYENASEYFNLAKKLKKKAVDTGKAIGVSEKELEDTGKEVERIEEQRETGKEIKRQWYHDFHWLITSEGLLAIGGKDAKQNELLVKKHLGDKDLFFHADIHGASAVVLKDGKKANEKSLHETAQFAGCYSSAWRARLAGVDVYSVEKDQVSLSAPTGEYLAKGSFLIVGKKQYFKGVEMKMYLGKKKGLAGVFIIPSSTGNEYFEVCYELIPGKQEKEEIAKKLSQELGQMGVKGVKADEIAVLLPGRSEVKRIK